MLSAMETKMSKESPKQAEPTPSQALDIRSLPRESPQQLVPIWADFMEVTYRHSERTVMIRFYSVVPDKQAHLMETHRIVMNDNLARNTADSMLKVVNFPKTKAADQSKDDASEDG
jgi:hypothetical protein